MEQNNAPSDILVVEDDPLVRATAVALLETLEHRVTGVPTAEAALQALEKIHHIDLLLTDIHFPGFQTGICLAHQVRLRWPNVAVLLTSGRSLPTAADLPTGARFIAKPYRANALFREVGLLMGTPASALRGPAEHLTRTDPSNTAMHFQGQVRGPLAIARRMT